MDTSNIFEAASRRKLRFNTRQGSIFVDDLWDLPLRSETKVNLNDIAKDLARAARASGEEEEFVPIPGTVTVANTVTLSLDIVKRVIAVKLEEKTETETKSIRAAQKQKLLELLDQKRTAALGDLTMEELQVQIAAL